MKNKYYILLLFFTITSVFATELKDPKLRDEDISGTLVSVEYFSRTDGLFEYIYTISNPDTNKGTIANLGLDLSCDFLFDPVSLPDLSDRPGYTNIAQPKEGTYTPVAIEGASSFLYGISSDYTASWGLSISPGQQDTGLRLISSAEPGMRVYKVEPRMDNDETWDYPEAADPSIPWIPDFTITGMIAGPGCPGVTEPPDTARYPGTGFRVEPDNINQLLSYRVPQKDRFHVAAGTKETTLHIYYANEMDAKTFKVEPAWMKKYFNPLAGTDEQVTLPLKKARNKIKLSVHTPKATGTARKNNELHHSYKDTDVFEIRVDE